MEAAPQSRMIRGIRFSVLEPVQNCTDGPSLPVYDEKEWGFSGDLHPFLEGLVALVWAHGKLEKERIPVR
jgi:hypothetical protein